MAGKKGLGRGLGAIFGEDTVAAASEKLSARKQRAAGGTNAPGAEGGSGTDVPRETSTIKISLIEPDPAQPRKNFDEEGMEELADSIREHGVIQPIIVRKSGSMYRIVVGERRWRAARMAGLTEVPAIVREFDDRQTAEVALIENIQRENLSSVEEARAFRSLLDDYGMTQEELAKRVSKNRTTITNSLRLLQLEDEILDMVESGELTAGHARAVLAINGRKARYKAAREIVNGDLSVRDAEKLAKKYNTQKREKKSGPDETDMYLDSLADGLTEKLGLKVGIRRKGKAGGILEIRYNSDEELEMIADRIGQDPYMA